MTDADDRMSKHARGPWRVEGGCVVAPWSELSPVKMDDGEIRMHATGLIALVYGCTDPGEPYSGPEANAHLIAAAPELLVLAKQYASECAECDGDGTVEVGENVDKAAEMIPERQPCPDCADIRAVIARAEGR